jgi:glycosyltransferase involved in cell wall biosynthesis
MLHRLPLKRRILLKKVIRMKGLKSLLIQLSPDIIQAFNIYSISCYEAAVVVQQARSKLFTENHIHASVFDMNNLRTRLKYMLLGFPRKLRKINRVTVKHYPIAKDVAAISQKYFHVPAGKIDIQSLGVDTDLFTPARTSEDERQRKHQREKLGFKEEDILCIYTGRFTGDKNPQCLARAINYLQGEGHHHIKALFVGSGTPDDVAVIGSMQGCVVHPFVRVNELPAFYRLADIGVWPRQESMSQLDAVACGLPVIVSNRVKVTERVERNGLLYEEDDYKDLADKILQLQDPDTRRKMGIIGCEKVRNYYSWDAIARKRVEDFKNSLGK